MNAIGAKTAAAKALLGKAGRLFESKAREAAVAIYDEVIERFGSSTTPQLREVVAMALLNKGVALLHLNRPEEAQVVLGQLIEKFHPDSGAACDQDVLARAMYLKGLALHQLERHEAAVAVLDQLVERFDPATEGPLQRLIAQALNLKGIEVGWCTGIRESSAVHAQVIQRFGMARDPGLQEEAATALLRVAENLEMSILYSLSFDFGAEDRKYFDTVLSTEALELMSRKNILSVADYQAVVLSALDEVNERFGDSVHSGVRKVIAEAMVHKGGYLVRIERHAEAIETYDTLIQRTMNETEPGMCDLVAKAMVKKAVLLHKLERNREAIDVCDKLVERFGTEAEPGLRAKVSEALACKAECVEVLSQLVKEFELKWRIEVRAAMFIVDKITKRFASTIQVSCGKDVGDGKEVAGWMTLVRDREHEKIFVVDGRAITNAGPAAGTRIKVAIKGPDAVAAMDALTELFSMGVRVSRCIKRGCPSPPILLEFTRHENRFVIQYGCSAWHEWQVEAPVVL
ncbi:MAG: tetratricopeptide repeat protein [Verrucomicrobia bacterium]|nr:tetratricopeptide repeat protein [Verrucomicrobiota bacterium]